MLKVFEEVSHWHCVGAGIRLLIIWADFAGLFDQIRARVVQSSSINEAFEQLVSFFDLVPQFSPGRLQCSSCSFGIGW